MYNDLKLSSNNEKSTGQWVPVLLISFKMTLYKTGSRLNLLCESDLKIKYQFL